MANKYVKVVSKDAVVDNNNFVERKVGTWFGKSTWPVPKAADGVKFPDLRYETDTQNTYIYVPDTDDWTEV